MKKLCLLLVLLCFIPSISLARNLHVGASATGSADGSSINNLCTLSYANTNLSAGDTAYLYDDGGVIVGRIAPANNGSPGLPITYQAASGETVVLSSPDALDAMGHRSTIAIIGSEGSEKEYIKIEGITSRSDNALGGQRFFNMSWANHITLEDCLFETPASDKVPDFTYEMSWIEDSSYIQFIDCEWNASTTPTGVDSQGDLLRADRLSHSLWDGCTFGDVSHTSLRAQDHTGNDYNALIDCTFNNKWRRGYEILQKHPYHTAANRWLMHGNTMANVGAENATCPTFADRGRHNSSKIHGTNFIFRENMSYGSDTGLTLGTSSATAGTDTQANNYVYHNTWYDCPTPAGNSEGGLAWAAFGLSDGLADNTIINNIFWKYDGQLGKATDYQTWVQKSVDGISPTGNTVAYNSFGRNDTGLETRIRWDNLDGSLSTVEAGTSQWHDNVLADPEFIDAANHNFTPKSSSIIDQATHLTLTNGSGSNSLTLTVDKASYFFSGPGAPWLLEGTEADTIYIEDSGAVTISSINYETNTITLSSKMTWGDNKKVYHRPYSGLGPDIGAYEHGNIAAPQGLTIK